MAGRLTRPQAGVTFWLDFGTLMSISRNNDVYEHDNDGREQAAHQHAGKPTDKGYGSTKVTTSGQHVTPCLLAFLCMHPAPPVCRVLNAAW